jgi:hypothetical protein
MMRKYEYELTTSPPLGRKQTSSQDRRMKMKMTRMPTPVLMTMVSYRLRHFRG